MNVKAQAELDHVQEGLLLQVLRISLHSPKISNKLFLAIIFMSFVIFRSLKRSDTNVGFDDGARFFQ